MFVQVQNYYTKISIIKEFMKIQLLFNQPKNDQSSIIPQLRLDQLRIDLNVLLITKVTYLFKGWYYSGFFCWPSKLPCSDFSFGNIFYVF